MFLSLEKNVLDTSIIEATKRVDKLYREHLAHHSKLKVTRSELKS